MTSAVPKCGELTSITLDSVGPFRPGQTVSDVSSTCRGIAGWDLGDEAIPQPAMVFLLGEARFELLFADTLPTSKILIISTRDSLARTTKGVGPGSSFSQLSAAYGKPKLWEGECLLEVTFASAPRLIFRLDTGQELECGEIGPIAKADAVTRLPASTRVEEVALSGSDNAT